MIALILGIVAVVALGLAISQSISRPDRGATEAAVTSRAVKAPPPKPDPSGPSKATASAPNPEPALVEAPSPEAAARVAPTTETSVAGSAADAAAPDAASGKIAVTLEVRPPDARVFHRGKEVGKPPLVVELDPGERRTFELSAPGYAVRKVRLDGSRSKVSVRLMKLPE